MMVTAAWIVIRKRAGCFVIFESFLARLSPSSSSLWILASVRETMAISALEKQNLKRLKISAEELHLSYVSYLLRICKFRLFRMLQSRTETLHSPYYITGLSFRQA